ncbi:peptide chain release factor N(5)-glutamine methyltransferase [Candidatus Omnitrophota bacterium]
MLKTLSATKNISYLINKHKDSIPRIERELLLSYIFKCRREALYVNELYFDGEIEGVYDSLVDRRLSGEPLQYIIGHAEFMGRDFYVTKDVFIPRPETEILLNEALSLATHLESSENRSLKILDLCTGCGNIAVSLGRSMPQARITATDISWPALRVAERNSIMHGTSENVAFYEGDLFKALPFNKRHKFDIIVCNPPYIKSSEIGSLQKEVRREPRIALDGGGEGLEFYKRIKSASPHYLKKGGALFLEIGFHQAQDVVDLFSSQKSFKVRKIGKDFSGLERVVWIDLL